MRYLHVTIVFIFPFLNRSRIGLSSTRTRSRTLSDLNVAMKVSMPASLNPNDCVAGCDPPSGQVANQVAMQVATHAPPDQVSVQFAT